MAKDTSDRVEQLATRLFADRTARYPGGQATEAAVLACYRDAEVFLQTLQKIQSGELSAKAPEGPQLADAHCPNLKPTHPLNMVSQRYGNLDRVRELHAKLTADPKIEELPDMDWDKHAVQTARDVFPAYVGSNN
jgi:hypothetical protein